MTPAYAFAKHILANTMTRGMEIDLCGAERIPDGSALLVCNHASAADPVVLMRCLPMPVGFLAAPLGGRLPIFRTLIRHAGSVVIASPGWREQIPALLAEGQKLVVFPEGQRWLRAQNFHAGLAPFHPGFAVFAHEARVPVVPVVIERIAFSVVPSLLNPLLRHLSDDAEAFEEPTAVVRYRCCRVRVLEPIAPSRFAGLPRRRAIDWLVEEAHGRMACALDGYTGTSATEQAQEGPGQTAVPLASRAV